MEANSNEHENQPNRCDLCNVTIGDKLSWELHLKGKKHTRAVERSSKKEEITTQGIFVRGFPPWSTPEQLKMFFSQFGEIKDFICGGSHNPFVIVQFVNRYSAQDCLSRQLYFYGWHLRISQRRMNEDIFPSKKPAPNEDVNDQIDNTHLLNVLASCESFEAQLLALIHELEVTDKEKFAVICQNLEATFSNNYPGCKAYPFGSSVTGLALKGSDMDIFMDLNLGPSVDKTVQEMQSTLVNKAKKLLYRSHRCYSGIIAIPKAKTPIVKFVHLPTNISCDLSFKNALGVHNSALIKHFISLDERLRPLLLIIKYWAKKNDLTGSGKLTHYALVMLVLFYLQQLSPPIIPTVYDIRSNSVIIDGWECSFNPSAWNPGHEKNTMTILELITGFFKFLSSFEFGLNVICPLIGKSIPKSLFQFPEKLPEAMNHYKEVVSDVSKSLKVDTSMCVQDPYELTHSLTAGVSQKKLELLKNYCIAAAKICCEVLSSPECDLTFFQKVFDVNIASAMSQQSKLIKIQFRKTPAWNILEEDELHERWFKAVFEFVLKIFEQVLKCDVKVKDEENSNEAGQHLRKVPRLDGQADVSNKCTEESKVQITEKFSNEKKVYCCGKCRFWDGRKAATKKITFAENIDPIAKETILSDFLMNKQAGVAPGFIIKFMCIFRLKRDPTQVELQLINQECTKGDFFCVGTFLQGRLPHWVGIGINQPQQEKIIEKNEN